MKKIREKLIKKLQTLEALHTHTHTHGLLYKYKKINSLVEEFIFKGKSYIFFVAELQEVLHKEKILYLEQEYEIKNKGHPLYL